MLEIAVNGVAGWNVELRKRRRYFFEAQAAAFRDIERAGQNLRRVLEDAIHLIVTLDEELRPVEFHARRVADRLAGLYAKHYILSVRIVFAQIVTVVGCDERQTEIFFQLEEAGTNPVLHRQALILDLKIKIVFAKNVAEGSSGGTRGIVIPFHQPLRDLAFQASRKPDQSSRMLRQKLLAHARLVVKAVE